MKNHRLTQLFPGPLDPSVLTRQKHHRSKDVWAGEVEQLIQCRRADGKFWAEVKRRPIHPRILQILINAGFYGVYRVGHIPLDNAFITALVERWRPETHTFHFKIGEATVTLQDVAILFGLPVDGEPVLGVDTSRTEEEWQDICEELLGFRPHNHNLDKSRLDISAVENHVEAFDAIDDDTDVLVVHQLARCYMMLIIGGILFPDTSGSKVKLMYLTQLDDISRIGRYSWGSAVLACLYRALCRASFSNKKEIGGFLPLLQVWAWERLKVIHPDRHHAKDGAIAFSDELPNPPYASRWNVRLSWTNTAHYVLPLFRDQLDNLVDGQFVWEPYTSDVMENLADYCRSGEYFWHVVVPLLCWDVVEMHQPNRVLRQFGMRQNIPSPCNFEDKHEKHDRRGRQNTDWTSHHARHILDWDDRRANCSTREAPIAGGPLPYDDDYLKWYRLITRQIIGNPTFRIPRGYASLAPAAEVMARQLHMLFQYGIELRQQPTMEVAGTKVMEMCSDGLTAAHEAERLIVPPSYVPTTGNSSNPRRRGRAGGRKKRRCTTTTNVAESSAMEDVNLDVEQPTTGDSGNPRSHGRAGGRGKCTTATTNTAESSPMEDANPDVERGCGMGENLNDEAQVRMGSSQFDYGSGSCYFDSQIVIYNATPLQQFPKINDSDGVGNDDGFASPAHPEQTVPLYSTPVPVTFESAVCVTTVESMKDDLEEQVFSFRGSASSTSLASTPIPSPRIRVPCPEDGTLTLDWVTELMSSFDWASRNLPPSGLRSVLPIEDFDRLVLMASNILHKEPNCVQIDSGSGLGPNSRVVVVGDVHGQLHDVLFLLRDAGFPSEDRFFVFNGDYVDRGAWGLETFLLLLAWKVFMPNRVFLLRGNHESKFCTSVYGFENEVLTKYGNEGEHVYQKCLGCFEGLPLASIIGGNVYTAHGGLFRSKSDMPRAKGKKRRKILSLGSLKELLEANRIVPDPPWEGTDLIPGDVMWSDPKSSDEFGLSKNKERGLGLLWGSDCTEDFLKKFNLKLIIRSREGPDAREKRPKLKKMDEGFTIDHEVESGKLITLFSAPDYPQFQATEERYRNKGAYIVLEPPNFDIPAFHSFEAVTPRPQANPYYEYEEVNDSDEELDLASMAT